MGIGKGIGMNPKLIEGKGDTPESPENPLFAQTRRCAIPAALSDAVLAGADSETIDRLIRTEAAALGLTAIVKMTAGVGDTPATVQASCARFLVERGAELVDSENLGKKAKNLLGSMSQEKLKALVQQLDDEIATRPKIADAVIVE